MAGDGNGTLVQCGALPFTLGEDSRPKVMLITSRGAGNWIIPKGWPISRLTRAETAAREAYEEAGVVGKVIGDEPFGTYVRRKRNGSGRRIQVDVAVYLLHVQQQLSRWPEKGQREMLWCDAPQAARLVAEPELGELIAIFASGATSWPESFRDVFSPAFGEP